VSVDRGLPHVVGSFREFGVREFGGQAKFLVAPSPESRSVGKKIQAIGSWPWENVGPNPVVSCFRGSKVGKHCIWIVKVMKCRASRARVDRWHIP
jgi:hypothetical protein